MINMSKTTKTDREKAFSMNQNYSKEQNKTAVALTYNPNEVAPKVIASGRGYLADKILNKAREEQIPIHQDAKLASSLSMLDIGEYIPKELYEVVAEVLAFVDSMDRIKGKVMDHR